MNVPEPRDPEVTFWRLAGETRRAQSDTVAAAMLLHRPEIATVNISRFRPNDISEPILARIAFMAAGGINSDGIADLEKIARLLPKFHFGADEIKVQLDRLRNVGEVLNSARAELAVRWLASNRQQQAKKKGRAAA